MKANFILIVLAVLLLCGCSQINEPIIGFMVPTYKISRYEKDRDFFVKKAESMGARVLVTNANDDDKLQLRQADSLIDAGAKILVVIAVNQNTAAAIVRKAHENNIKVIAYEKLINNSELDLLIGFDHYKVGQMMATYSSRIKTSGSYVVLGGDLTDKNAEYIRDGQLSILRPLIESGSISIAYAGNIEEWSGEAAYMEMKRFLKLSGEMPEVVLAANDNIAAGAIQALREYNLIGNVVVTGLDADLGAIRQIQTGAQTMTVYKQFKKQAEIAAEYAVAIILAQRFEMPTTVINNGRKDVPVLFIEPVIVDQANISQTVIADGFYKNTDLYNTDTFN